MACHEIDVMLYKGMILAAEDDFTPADDNNFEQEITKQLKRNAELESQIQIKEEEMEDVLEELPLKMFQYSKKSCKNVPEDILDLLEKKNNINDDIESLVRISLFQCSFTCGDLENLILVALTPLIVSWFFLYPGTCSQHHPGVKESHDRLLSFSFNTVLILHFNSEICVPFWVII